MQKLEENGNATQEGYCIKCAKELGLKPINDFFDKMGLDEEELEAMDEEMTNMMENGDFPLMPGTDDSDDEDDENDDESSGRAPSINLGSIFGGAKNKSETSNEQETTEEDEKDGKKDKKKKKKGRKNLEAFCTNLTEKAKNGEIDKVIGRTRELERILQILCRRQKNNPCLIGEPGVGKTAVAEALALKIAQGDVPQKLRDKEVYLVDMTSVVAGTQFRGQFENRMKGLIEEVKKFGNIILVIDEIHSIVSAGNAEGGMNAGNILKPALSRGEIQVIGATTLAEYRKYIEKDAALERRFQPVMINEPSIKDTVKILEGIKSYYEDFHKVKIPAETVEKAVLYSERYITDRFLPDKAIDLIDEAAAYLSINDISIEKCAELAKEMEDIRLKRESIETAVDGADEIETYKQLAELKSRELEASKEYEKFKSAAENVTLLPEHLSHCIEIWTGIPASSINESEFIRIDKLEERLKKRIIGQDHAVSMVAKAIKRSRAGIAAKRKPCSFIFAGPTGVGKTELVKTIANDLFDSPEALIRLDMSEFMEKHAVSRIIGAPPGYVGYDEAGQLTEKIRRRPYSVVLFDEIEKAHPDVMNILLQILDDGKITDAQGREVNFENAMLVLTTNAGSSTGMNSIGFSEKEGSIAENRIMNALSEFLRPEFINRIDEIVVFNQLKKQDFCQIAEIMLGDLKQSLAEKNIAFEYSDSAVEYIAEKSYSRKFGARNLRRYIQNEIEDKAAEIIISKYDAKIRGIYVTFENERLNVVEVNA